MVGGRRESRSVPWIPSDPNGFRSTLVQDAPLGTAARPGGKMGIVSKPVLDVHVATPDGRSVATKALVDSGSFYTIVREDVLPTGAGFFRFEAPRPMNTAGKEGSVQATGVTVLVVSIGGKRIQCSALVSPDLRRELILGAEAMQGWDITIRNRNGHTEVLVGRDMDDPELTEVD